MERWSSRTKRISIAIVSMVAVAVLAGVLAAGCGSSSSSSSSSSPAASADILRLAYTSTVTTWDPSASFSTEVVYMATCTSR